MKHLIFSLLLISATSFGQVDLVQAYQLRTDMLTKIDSVVLRDYAKEMEHAQRVNRSIDILDDADLSKSVRTCILLYTIDSNFIYDDVFFKWMKGNAGYLIDYNVLNFGSRQPMPYPVLMELVSHSKEVGYTPLDVAHSPLFSDCTIFERGMESQMLKMMLLEFFLSDREASEQAQATASDSCVIKNLDYVTLN